MKKIAMSLMFLMLPLGLFFNATDLRADEESAALSGVRELAGQIGKSLRDSTHITRRVAVIDFEDLTTKSEELNLGKALSEMLTTEILKSGEYEVVERSQLNGVMRELRLGLAGIIDSSTAKEVGRIIGADAIIGGSVTEIGNYFSISARVIDVETARILTAQEMEIEQDELITVSTRFVVLRKYPITAGLMSAVVPGWGQFYNDEPLKGGLILGTQLLSVGGILYSHYRADRLMDSYRQNTPSSVGYYKEADRWYAIRDALFLASLGISAYAVGDAIAGAWLYGGGDDLKPEEKLRDLWERANLKDDLLAEEVLGNSKRVSEQPEVEEIDGKKNLEIIDIEDYESLKKDRTIATFLALFPGMLLHGIGNFYAGDTQTGLWLLGLEGLSIAMMGLGSLTFPSAPDPAIGALVIGELVFIATWVYDIILTQSALERYNENLSKRYEVRVP
jgi:TolB-like protein/TM2 domain-containing membrane protein YozV